MVYVAGVSGTVFALAADTGEDLWTYTIKNFVESRKNVYVFQGTFLCPNGVTSTPVIDKGDEHALRSGRGRNALRTRFGQRHRALWSGSVRCAILEELESQSHGWQGLHHNLVPRLRKWHVRVLLNRCSEPHHPVVDQTLLSNTNTAGIWGRGGPVIGTNGRMYGWDRRRAGSTPLPEIIRTR